MLLHIGAGYVDQHGPTSFVLPRNSFDPASIGLTGLPQTGVFPLMNGLVCARPSATAVCKDHGPGDRRRGSPAARACGGIHSRRTWQRNVSLTWIRGNHTYKLGAEAIIGNYSYGQSAVHHLCGQFTFSNAATSDSALFGVTDARRSDYRIPVR